MKAWLRIGLLLPALLLAACGKQVASPAPAPEAARDGKLYYALSNPATSNQGFMALMGVAAAASGKPDALTAADVDRGAISAFIKGYRLPGDNSTYISEKFIEQQGARLNAFIN